MIITVVSVFHVIAAILLIGIVLIQGGKGSEMGAAFGGASQTVFGSSGGTTFFTKITTFMAIVFMLTSIGLAKMSTGRGKRSVVPTNVEETIPAPPPTTGMTSPEAPAQPPKGKDEAEHKGP